MPTKEQPPTFEQRQLDLMERQIALQEKLAENQPRRQKSIADYKPVTAFNPTGAKRTIPVVYQNGALIDEGTLLDSEVALLPQLKTGKFCNRTVTVYQDLSKPERPWLIDYNNSTVSQRMELSKEFNSFEQLLKRITTETPEPIM